jgi:hypothetical protein
VAIIRRSIVPETRALSISLNYRDLKSDVNPALSRR